MFADLRLKMATSSRDDRKHYSQLKAAGRKAQPHATRYNSTNEAVAPYCLLLQVPIKPNKIQSNSNYRHLNTLFLIQR